MSSNYRDDMRRAAEQAGLSDGRYGERQGSGFDFSSFGPDDDMQFRASILATYDQAFKRGREDRERDPARWGATGTGEA